MGQLVEVALEIDVALKEQAEKVFAENGLTLEQATILFFEATNMVKNNPKHLAIIEATQSGEVIFTLIGGILFLGDAMPAGSGLVGILIIVAGMVLNSFLK